MVAVMIIMNMYSSSLLLQYILRSWPTLLSILPLKFKSKGIIDRVIDKTQVK
jgi:hypothetical protein